MRAIIAALCLACLPACSDATNPDEARPPSQRPTLGLFTSLPILWAETADMGEMIRGEGERSWAGAALERSYVLQPLDMLEPQLLAGQTRILLAQPRPLAPSENVALDAWVREGGRAVIFADPLLTRHSQFSIGDKRRSQDVVLLSPILARWGLSLSYDEAQPEGERTERAGHIALPVDQAGRFALVEPGAPARCSLAGDGLIAQCSIGKGHVTLVADAALFEWDESEVVPSERQAALHEILDTAFPD